MDKKEMTFEEKMNKLEDIVRKIDSGDLNLDDNLKYYLKGTKLINELEKTIKEAKEKIENIQKDND